MTFRYFDVRGRVGGHPHDPAVWRYRLQYRLGNALLVVPVVEPGVDRVTAYLPEGEWVDVWREERHLGPAEVTLPAPIDQSLVLCRAEHWPELRSVFVPGPG